LLYYFKYKNINIKDIYAIYLSLNSTREFENYSLNLLKAPESEYPEVIKVILVILKKLYYLK
jgi:hypothetical protein